MTVAAILNFSFLILVKKIHIARAQDINSNFLHAHQYSHSASHRTVFMGGHVLPYTYIRTNRLTTTSVCLVHHLLVQSFHQNNNYRKILCIVRTILTVIMSLQTRLCEVIRLPVSNERQMRSEFSVNVSLQH